MYDMIGDWLVARAWEVLTIASAAAAFCAGAVTVILIELHLYWRYEKRRQ